MEATPVTNNGSENQHGATNVNTANPSGDEERKETDSFDDEEQINLGITINVEEPSEARLESESLLSLLGPVTPLSSEPITITDLEEKNSYILYFDISWNMLGPKGVKGICKGLVKNVTLEHFILSYNNIGTKGCLHLKNALTSNVGLKILDISTNNIMSKGVVDLAKGLMSNTQLEKLYLHGNVFGSEAVDSLINVLNSQNSGLKYLDIRNISITKEQEAKLQKTREKRLFEINHHPWVTGRDFTFL
ncbi:leucine-rich repeat-containing protein 74B-like isoform X1 [Argonauta hians]